MSTWTRLTVVPYWTAVAVMVLVPAVWAALVLLVERVPSSIGMRRERVTPNRLGARRGAARTSRPQPLPETFAAERPVAALHPAQPRVLRFLSVIAGEAIGRRSLRP